MSIWIYQPAEATLYRQGQAGVPAVHGDMLAPGDRLTTCGAGTAFFTASGATITLGSDTDVIATHPSPSPNWYPNPENYAMMMCAGGGGVAYHNMGRYPYVPGDDLNSLRIDAGALAGCLRDLDGGSCYHFAPPSATAASQDSDLVLRVDAGSKKARVSCSRGLVKLVLGGGATHMIACDESVEYAFDKPGKASGGLGNLPIAREDAEFIENSIWDWQLLGEFVFESACASSGGIEFACELPVGDLPDDLLPSMLGLVVSSGQAENESSVFAAFDPAEASRATLFDRSWLEDIIRPGEDKAKIYAKIKRQPK